jgi:hypothetical protein
LLRHLKSTVDLFTLYLQAFREGPCNPACGEYAGSGDDGLSARYSLIKKAASRCNKMRQKLRFSRSSFSVFAMFISGKRRYGPHTAMQQSKILK